LVENFKLNKLVLKLIWFIAFFISYIEFSAIISFKQRGSNFELALFVFKFIVKG
jgi:hypothetical protein